MPSAKSHRAHLRKAEVNRSIRSFSRSRLALARNQIDSEPDSDLAPAAVKDAIAALDRAANKGVIHRNQAARKKSRLQRKLNLARQS